MQQDIAIERLFQSLIAGDRTGARQLVSEYLASGHRSEDLAIDVLWPSMQTLFQMWRNDQLSTLAHRYATRMMRMIVDQAQASYAQAPRNGRRVACVGAGPSSLTVARDLALQGYAVTVFDGERKAATQVKFGSIRFAATPSMSSRSSTPFSSPCFLSFCRYAT